MQAKDIEIGLCYRIRQGINKIVGELKWIERIHNSMKVRYHFVNTHTNEPIVVSNGHWIERVVDPPLPHERCKVNSNGNQLAIRQGFERRLTLQQEFRRTAWLILEAHCQRVDRGEFSSVEHALSHLFTDQAIMAIRVT
jgi:hypothetical protein